MDLNQVPDGWWIYVTPLAKINPEEWILGVLRKGKKSWVTELSMGGFSTPQEAFNIGINFINEKK